MSTEVKAKQWGNSLGIIIPKNLVNDLKIEPEESILVEIEKKQNPLRELSELGKGKKIHMKTFLENRKSLESKYM